MDIEISKTSFETVHLSDNQVSDIAKRYLKKMLYPGEWISADDRLMADEEHYHGSTNTKDYGAASAKQQAAWIMLLHMQDAEKEKQKSEEALAKMKQTLRK